MDDPLAAADQLVHAAGRKAPLLISPKLSGHLPPSANPFPTSLQGPPPIDHHLPPGINLIPPHADDQGSILLEPLAVPISWTKTLYVLHQESFKLSHHVTLDLLVKIKRKELR